MLCRGNGVRNGQETRYEGWARDGVGDERGQRYGRRGLNRSRCYISILNKFVQHRLLFDLAYKLTKCKLCDFFFVSRALIL